jgi:uncharacterized protein
MCPVAAGSLRQPGLLRFPPSLIRSRKRTPLEVPLKRDLFHLSIPVLDLESSRQFYVDGLGATAAGQRSPEWLDLFLWGHQLTLHHQPEQVLSPEQRGVRHFGVVLPWEEWEEAVRLLREREIGFVDEPSIRYAGTPEETAKVHLEDPSGNLIEIKAYRNFKATFGIAE